MYDIFSHPTKAPHQTLSGGVHKQHKQKQHQATAHAESILGTPVTIPRPECQKTGIARLLVAIKALNRKRLRGITPAV